MAKNDEFILYNVDKDEIINTIKEKGLTRKNSDKFAKFLTDNQDQDKKLKFSSVNFKKFNETDIFITNTKDIKDVDKHSEIANHTLISGLKNNKVINLYNR
jgi:hypothetical protein